MNQYEITIPPQVSSSNSSEQSFSNKLDIYDSFLIFSPHFDDAILSMGSLLAYLVKSNKSVYVINIFTQGSNLRTALTDKLLKQSGFSTAAEYFQARAEEDATALSSIGPVHITNLGCIDAPWRSTASGNPLYPQTTLNTYTSPETGLEDYLKASLPRQKNSLVFAPIARGRHTDHLIVRSVCSDLFSPIVYYSDFPYSQNFHSEDEFIFTHHLTPIIWTGNYYQQKASAILQYHTQLGSLFSSSPLRLPHECYYVLSQ